MNRRICTLIMRGLSAAEAARQARAELAPAPLADPVHGDDLAESVFRLIDAASRTLVGE